MSHYHFGLHLEGAFPPNAYQGLQSSVCGPETFLSALEAALGLPPLDQQPLQRTLAYRNLIAATMAEEPFYARSFRCDPLATARLLLSWRDSLNEADWHAGLDHGDAPLRLQAIANLESAYRDDSLADATHAGRIATILAPPC